MVKLCVCMCMYTGNSANLGTPSGNIMISHIRYVKLDLQDAMKVFGIYVCIHVCTGMYVCMNILACIDRHVYIHVYSGMYVCMHILPCMYACIY